MFHVKKQYQITAIDRDLIQSIAQTNGRYSQPDTNAIENLCTAYANVQWWVAFQEPHINRLEAKHLALVELAKAPLSMTKDVACQVFRTALRQRGGIQMMLAAIYEEVTEETYGHLPTPTDWGKERDRLQGLREKAIAELAAMDLPAAHLGCLQIDPIESYIAPINGVGKHMGIVVFIANGMRKAESFSTEVIIAVLLAAKAIEGGNKA